jgi:hypothetical protein
MMGRNKLFMADFEHHCVLQAVLNASNDRRGRRKEGKKEIKKKERKKEIKKERRKKERKKERKKGKTQMGFTVQLSASFSTLLQSVSFYLSKDLQYTSSQVYRNFYDLLTLNT